MERPSGCSVASPFTRWLHLRLILRGRWKLNDKNSSIDSWPPSVGGIYHQEWELLICKLLIETVLIGLPEFRSAFSVTLFATATAHRQSIYCPCQSKRSNWLELLWESLSVVGGWSDSSAAEVE